MRTLLRKIKRRKKSKSKNGVKYICSNCGATEIIPHDVIEHFDAVDPERLLHGPATFTCEKCGSGYMQPEHYKAIVKGYGLYEGLDYSIIAGENNKKH